MLVLKIHGFQKFTLFKTSAFSRNSSIFDHDPGAVLVMAFLSLLGNSSVTLENLLYPVSHWKICFSQYYINKTKI